MTRGRGMGDPEHRSVGDGGGGRAGAADGREAVRGGPGGSRGSGLDGGRAQAGPRRHRRPEGVRDAGPDDHGRLRRPVPVHLHPVLDVASFSLYLLRRHSCSAKRRPLLRPAPPSRRGGDRLHRRQHGDDRVRRHGLHAALSRPSRRIGPARELRASGSPGLRDGLLRAARHPDSEQRRPGIRPRRRDVPRPGGEPVLRVRRGLVAPRRFRCAGDRRTFGDVPASHPFYQFIEALAASGITGGCGPGVYCPDAPLTRGQMAAFLSKALGLHWPE